MIVEIAKRIRKASGGLVEVVPANWKVFVCGHEAGQLELVKLDAFGEYIKLIGTGLLVSVEKVEEMVMDHKSLAMLVRACKPIMNQVWAELDKFDTKNWRVTGAYLDWDGIKLYMVADIIPNELWIRVMLLIRKRGVKLSKVQVVARPKKGTKELINDLFENIDTIGVIK